MKSAQDITKELNSIAQYQSIRQELLQRHFYMYGHSTLMGQTNPIFTVGREGVRFNLVQSCVDTLINKISKNKPRPTFLTDNGDWGLRKKAEKLEQYVFGMFDKLDVYKKSPTALLNALVYGDGFLKVYSEGKDIKIEHAITTEIIVDEHESIYGNPRRMWQIRFVDKDTLKELHPDKRERISLTQSVQPPFYMSMPVATSNLVLVIEYWKLPVKVDGKLVDGEHRIVCGDFDLIPPEKWERERFPFAKIGFVDNLVGYWSKGAAELITPHQIETNRTLKRISDALRLIASPKVLYEYGSKIVQAHFNNDVGAMIGYTGTPPQFLMPQAVGAELFTHLQYIVQSAYNELGISQLSAQAQKPLGLNSGKALREYYDIETERFAALQIKWEQFHMDLADLILQESRAIAKEHGNLAVMTPDKKGCKVINFKEVNLKEDTYSMKVYPTSMLPKEPSGRLDYVQEMTGAGLISPEEALSLLDFPDTEKITKLKNAPLDDILATIDIMLDNDEFLPPEPYQNLQLGVKYMQSAYLRYKNDGCPEEKLELLVRWVDQALLMMQPPQEQMPTASDLEAPPTPEANQEAPQEQPLGPEIPV